MNASKGYQLVQRIGMGAGGAVYLAKTDTGEVAIRQFESKAEPASQAWLDERQWFLQAGRQALSLTHPRIVPVIDVIDEAGEAFVVMEYMAASTLATALLTNRRFTQAETDTILHQVATALDFAHSRGVVHGDLKPADIFLTDKGAMVSDFAISPRARRSDGRSIPSSLVHGYLSPEHLRGFASLGPRSDQYSLAVIAYQMYTGRSPYGENVMDLPGAILNVPIVPPSQVDPQLPSSIDGPLLRALNRDPELRYASCMELVAFLGASLITQAETPRRRSKLLYVLVPVVLLALLALIWFWPRKPAKKPVPPVVAQQAPAIAAPVTSLPPVVKPVEKRPVAKTPVLARKPVVTEPKVEPAKPTREEPEPVAAASSQFTIDLLSRKNKVEEGVSFPVGDAALGELAQGDLAALVSFDGRRPPAGPLELEWTVGGVVMDRKKITLKRDQGAALAAIVEYGNEPSPGDYRITLKLKGHLVKSFMFRITK